MDTIASLDAGLLRWIAGTLRTPWLDAAMRGVGWLTVWGTAYVAAGVALTIARRDGRLLMALWRLVLAVALASVVAVSVLKPVIDRPRPFQAHGDISVVGRPASGASMPSGHAATAVAGAYALALMWPAARALGWALAALVLFSRMYLGVHYPTDLIVGGLIGWACAYIATGGAPCLPHPAARGHDGAS